MTETLNEQRARFGLPPVALGDHVSIPFEYPLHVVEAMRDALVIELAKHSLGCLSSEIMWHLAIAALKASGRKTIQQEQMDKGSI